MRIVPRVRTAPRLYWAWGAAMTFSILFLFAPGAEEAAAQQILTEADQVIEVARGRSALVRLPRIISRVHLADDDIANFELMSPNEILIWGRTVGTTSMWVWDETGRIMLFSVEVPADVAALERHLRALFPDTDLTATASGTTVILSGNIRDPGIVRRIIEIARSTTGATVINNIQAPSAQQVLLHVRFAEVSRSVVEALGTNLFLLNPQNIDRAFRRDSEIAVETLSEGLVRLFLLGDDVQLEAVIRALKGTGEFRSLAEPNLVALEGEEATFLAGGEFPYPVVQSGAAQQAVTIQWKEFGVRLSFTPTVTNIGSVRLRVAPEVSSLDFANALTFQGFQIPSVITRRAESEVELRPGQHLAIAGLLDNELQQQVDKIPFLGHLPIIGALFSSRSRRQDRTELLVVVTPHIVEPTDLPIELPTGEPEQWRWDRRLRIPPGYVPPMHPRGENR